MAIRQIIYSDNPVLRKKARRVGRISRATQTLIDDMIETMRASNGIGLAATQVAVSERVIVVEPPEAEGEDENAKRPLYVVLNPEIVKVSAETEEDVEGCLSVPGWAGRVERPVAITLKGLDRRGDPVRLKFDGYVARIFQHEVDHLDGVLFIDHITDPAKIWRVEEGEEGGQRRATHRAPAAPAAAPEPSGGAGGAGPEPTVLSAP